MKRYIILAVTALGCLVGMAHRVSLDSGSGADWQLFAADDAAGVSGTVISTSGYKAPRNAVAGVVPGVVFSAFVDAGKEENPEFGDNIYEVDESKYNRPFWYRLEFATPAKSAGERVWLTFDNTHRYADFYLNGVKISGSPYSTRDVKGVMLRSRFDITDRLAADGNNVVAVLITDPDQKKTRTAPEPYGNSASPSYLSAAGWDWMPYVPGRLAGITGKVYLDITGDVVIENPWVRGILNGETGEVKVAASVSNRSTAPRTVKLRGTVNPGEIKFEKTLTVPANGSVGADFDVAEFPQLSVDNPSLWWPNGYGDQNLYTCTLEAEVDGKVSQSQEVSFGIRRYEWRQETNSEGYPVWQLYVNNRRIFIKGGNWGISEYLLRCHDDEYEKKIRLHKDMNFNMIRLWTGCVTDEEFYHLCDRYGIMVWDDFWLYFSYFGVDDNEAFKLNARSKVMRLRNHPCIALWCGANESHPSDELDSYLRKLIADEDGGDRMYKSCSNDEGLSGSGWWFHQKPDDYFNWAANALIFGGYKFSGTSGYGLRSEVGMATFPNYDSVELFMPVDRCWPLPDDETLKNVDNTVWNHHFFGKEGGNASPADYKNSVNTQYGEASSLRDFCEKAQLLNIECMKGIYEAWNDKMWNDASGVLLWMSNPAYPSFLWQTYDYYHDATGAYWGAKSACEQRHVQWNSLTGSVKVVNTTSTPLEGATVTAEVFDGNGKSLAGCSASARVDVAPSDKTEAFVLSTADGAPLGLRFIRLRLLSAAGEELSRNVYWHNNASRYDYRSISTLPQASVACDVTPDLSAGEGHYLMSLTNNSEAVAVATRIRLVDSATGERILPVIMSDNYVTLMPRETRVISIEVPGGNLPDYPAFLVKPFGGDELTANFTQGGIDTPAAGEGAFRCYACGSRTLMLEWNGEESREVAVYTPQGSLVAAQTLKPRNTVGLPAGGLYLVRAGSESCKVLVK